MIFPLLNSHKGKPNNALSACKIDIPFPFQTLGYRDLKIIKNQSFHASCEAGAAPELQSDGSIRSNRFQSNAFASIW